jgi:hypothetical protein
MFSPKETLAQFIPETIFGQKRTLRQLILSYTQALLIMPVYQTQESQGGFLNSCLLIVTTIWMNGDWLFGCIVFILSGLFYGW